MASILSKFESVEPGEVAIKATIIVIILVFAAIAFIIVTTPPLAKVKMETPLATQSTLISGK